MPTVSIIDARKCLETPIVPTLNKRIEQDFMTDEPNKLAYDHLFSGIIHFKHKFNFFKENVMYTCMAV